MDFVYERSFTPEGVKIETVTGGSRYSGKVWRQIAMQIYCENGKDGYREVGHYPNGAPFLYGTDDRISISHTEGCLVVATLRRGPEDAERLFGIDVEPSDRRKVVDLRERFLTEEELALVPADSVEANVVAWTCKEAMLKAGMEPAINWHRDIVITALPEGGKEGSGFIRLNGERHDFRLSTRRYDGFIVTLALES